MGSSENCKCGHKKSDHNSNGCTVVIISGRCPNCPCKKTFKK